MEIIQDQLASLWLLSPIGLAVVVGLTALVLYGVPARIIDYIDTIRIHRRATRTRLAAPYGATVADGASEAARMGR